MSEPIDFSIIIPTHDRPFQLSACLEAIANLQYPRARFEVIVVNDGSSAPAEPVIAPFRDRMHVVLRSQPRAGPASARNAGAALARGRFLALTDDDCRPAPDWLEKLAARLEHAPGTMVGGRTINALRDSACSTTSQLLCNYLYEYYNRDPDRPGFLASCNLALPSEPFRALGGFDCAYPRAAAEDRDLCDRWRLSGYGMVYAPEAVVYHEHALRLSTFWQQHLGYGRGAFLFWQAHAGRSEEKIRVEPPRFYLGLALYPFRQAEVRRPVFVSALLIASQIANALGFFREWARHQRRRPDAATPRAEHSGHGKFSKGG